GDQLGSQAPRIFYVNWFRKNREGKWLWPGFGENSRALKWMCERLEGSASAAKTAIGYVPTENDLDLNGLNWPCEYIQEVLRVDVDAWRLEVPDIEKFFAQFGHRLPVRLTAQLRGLASRLG
ncbi:MAG: phosphoenolpyruvate carboxykinase (GTP), partial [Chloroflexi bacterium]|nr:phosphoenolpyruvate carboxykinase (GTP) [Chloroflexota bacterium]